MISLSILSLREDAAHNVDQTETNASSNENRHPLGIASKLVVKLASMILNSSPQSDYCMFVLLVSRRRLHWRMVVLFESFPFS